MKERHTIQAGYEGLCLMLCCLVLLMSCGKDSDHVEDLPPTVEDDLTQISFDPQEYELDLPPYFPALEQPSDNLLTIEGVELGRRLFYDPILSLDSTISCSSCHLQERAFADGLAVSTGVQGAVGKRSAMSLVNTGLFYNGLFWDGRSTTLEEQALIPVEDPLEMHESWPHVEQKLSRHPLYPELFRKAFGIERSRDISSELVAEALSQFQRTIVSHDSKFDKWFYETASGVFPTDEEFNGYTMFFDHSGILPDAECGHCHNMPLFTTNEYFNNGVQQVESYEDFEDKGVGGVTGNRFDNGKFRAPSLRNIALTAPYMHDGRFATLDEVLEHYNSGGHVIGNVDPLIRPLALTEKQQKEIIAFLHMLTDTTVLSNPAYSDPWN